MRRCAVLPLLAVAVLCAALLHAPAAVADGDPASDVLLGQRAFLPYDITFPAAPRRELQGLLAEGASEGFPIRVALIGSAYDLGSIGQLWGKPQLYAKFLGTELSLVYHGRLLVVMPAGFGLYYAGRSVATEQRALAGIAVKPGGRGLVESATAAVQRLARNAGHPLARPSPARIRAAGRAAAATSHSARDVIVVAIGLVVILGALTISLRLRPTRRRLRLRLPRPSARIAGLLAAAACLAGLAVAAVIVVNRAGGTRTESPPAPTEPGATWGPHQAAAPRFRLVDQTGRAVTDRPTGAQVAVVTFIDPLCRDYCPLEARVLERATQALPAGERPEIVAVSVDPHADTPQNFALDKRKWSLGSNWHWAVGTAAQLTRIWSAYKIGVQVVHQRTAGVSVEKIAHTEAAYVVDRNGFERALFIWPFTVADVTRTIGSLAHEATRS